MKDKSKKRKSKRTIIIISTIVVLLIIACSFLVFFIYTRAVYLVSFSYKNQSHLFDDRLATPENAVKSLSGRYTLIVEALYQNDMHFNRFSVLDNNHQIIFTCDEKYRTRDRLYFTWGDDDDIWVYSGDIGCVYWKRVSDTQWIPVYQYSQYSVTIPDAIAENLHKY